MQLNLIKFPKRKILLVTGLIFLLIIIIISLKVFISKLKQKEIEKPTIKVKVSKIKQEDLSQKYPVMGTIKGAIENELRFEIEGTLLKYNYREGARVTKGSIIAFLDTKDAMTKLSYAKSRFGSEKSAYFSAQERLKVYEDLYKLKAISESKLKEMQFEVESIREKMQTAQAELELAQSNLLKTNLIAPSDGILAKIIIHPGEFITPNDIVAKFVNAGDANFEVEIPEKDVLQMKTGLEVTVLCDSYPDKEFIGTVNEIAPMVEERTRTVKVKVRLPNKEGLLHTGMFARGEVLISGATNVISVFSDSVVSLGEETKLLPILKPIPQKQNQGVVELRQIKVGQTIGKSVVVTDGVEIGEFYITETSGELSDGIVAEFTETE